MISYLVALVVSTALLMFTSISVINADTVYDLSHVQEESTIYWPRVPGFNRSVIMASSNRHSIWIEVGATTSGEHGGTHIDVPRHFFKDGLDLKDFPLKDTIAEGVMIDCRKEAAENRDYGVPLSKVQEWEKEHGQIPNGAAVLFYFGHAQKFHDPSAFLGSSNVDDPSTFHFPYIEVETVRWLLSNRNIKMVGLDTPSPDQPQDDTFPSHLVLLPRQKLILENVNIPPNLPARDFRVHAAPIKVKGGTGTQTRIYAMLLNAGNSFGVSCSGVCMLVLCVVGVFTYRRSV